MNSRSINLEMPSAATDLARNVPLTGMALYLSFISQYGTAIVTTLAILYGGYQFWCRYREHSAIMRKNEMGVMPA